MPYIPKKERIPYDPLIEKAVELLLNKLPANNSKKFEPGELNYIISSIVWQLFDTMPSYTRANELIGVLECVKQEFIRMKLNNYEDKKIKENGIICDVS